MPLELGEQEMAALAALLEEISEENRHPGRARDSRLYPKIKVGRDDREATSSDAAIAHLARSKRG